MVPKPGQPPCLSCHPWTFGPDLLKSFGGQERRGLEGNVLPSSSRWGRMHTGFSQTPGNGSYRGSFSAMLRKHHAVSGVPRVPMLWALLIEAFSAKSWPGCHQPQPSFSFGCLRNCSNFGLGRGEAGRASQGLAGLHLESRALVSQG